MGPSTIGQTALEERKTIAYSATAIFVGAIVVAGVQTALPGGPETSLFPGLVALAMAPVAFFAGPHMPRRLLAVFAPAGVACIAWGLATTTGGQTDGAVLYIWPVLWMSYFYGRAGAVFIVACVAVAQGLALAYMPDDMVSIDRWIDVVASVTVVAAVLQYLAARNARLVRDLEEQARIDPLTGLLNRRGLEERMGIEITRALRHDTTMSVALVDIDHFKNVNDEHGHEVGDRVLAWVGSVLGQQTRGVDAAARTGGDEFTVFMPDADLAAGRLFADRLRQAVARGDAQGGRGRLGVPDKLHITVSVGVATGGPHEAEALMETADKVLYAAKGEGRNRVHAGEYAELRRSGT